MTDETREKVWEALELIRDAQGEARQAELDYHAVGNTAESRNLCLQVGALEAAIAALETV